MKSSGVVLVLLLAIATASSRLSLAAASATAHDHESGASIPAILDRELREFIARADNTFRSSGAGGWRAAAAAANATADADAEAKNLRAVAASRRRRPANRKSAGCVSAAACRKGRVICAKRCYRASRAARLTHVPSRCVVKCRKCVPTC